MRDKPFRETKVLSVFSLAMISVVAILNLRNLPVIAGNGFSLVFFCVLAVIVFLIPSALVCSELASNWPEAGGVYLWTQKAFGYKTGFFTIWSEWFNNVIGFPATLSFISVTIAFVFIPSVKNHGVVIFVFMLLIIWATTLFNFFGIKASSRLNIVGAIAGVIVPAIVIIVLGAVWFFSGKHLQIDFSLGTLFPSFHMKDMVFFLGILNGFAGMQITAFHIRNVKNPRLDFPKAVAIASFIIVAITILASLSIAITVPSSHLNLVSGLMQGFSNFFSQFHIMWALPILALLIVVSGISSLSAWLLGPARGLAVAAKEGFFPKWCAKCNSKGMPVNILLMQAVIATFLSTLFLFAPLGTAFWLLIVLTGQFTLVMYILVFASAIKLRYVKKVDKSTFHIPLGKVGIWIVAGLSIVFCVFGITVGFFPPASFAIKDTFHYDLLLIFGDIIYLSVPIVIYRMKHKS